MTTMTTFLNICGRAPLSLCTAAALALSLGACGDDSGSDDGSNGSSTGTVATSTSGDSTDTSDPTTTGETPGTSESTAAADTTMGGDATDSTGDDSGSSDSGSSGEQGLAIAGEYSEDLGKGETIEHTITDETWLQESPFGDSLYHIDGWDNEAQWIVAQGDEDNDFNAGLYSKFVWAWEDDVLYYCTAVFDAETAEDAEAARDPDSGNLESGCSGFPWSRLD